MREFLFRGKKIIGTDEWVYGDFIHNKKNRAMIRQIIAQPLFKDENDNFSDTIYACGDYVVDPETVSQSTGFYDMVTNKPIFEGDIVEDIKGHCGVIEWRQDEAAYIIKYSTSYEEEMCFKYGVVGNKWDNPELLERK